MGGLSCCTFTSVENETNRYLLSAKFYARSSFHWAKIKKTILTHHSAAQNSQYIAIRDDFPKLDSYLVCALTGLRMNDFPPFDSQITNFPTIHALFSPSETHFQIENSSPAHQLSFDQPVSCRSVLTATYTVAEMCSRSFPLATNYRLLAPSNVQYE